MDPDPFSLFGTISLIILKSSLGAISFFVVVVLILLSLLYSFVLNVFSKALSQIDESELNDIEKTSPEIFKSLRNLYNKMEYLSTLFIWNKVFFLLVFVGSFIFLQLQFKINFYLIVTNIIAFYALVMVMLPKIIVRNNAFWVSLGIRFCESLLQLTIPAAKLFEPPTVSLPQGNVSLEELRTVLPQSEQGRPSASHVNLYRKILRFDKIKIRNVMRPKHEIEGVNANINFTQLLAVIETSQFSRLPVYNNNLDQILGIIHCKDLLPFTDLQEMDWKKLIRTIIYVNENDLAMSVLRVFQHSKNHMDIVRNDQFDLVGIVTLEDITEEIIGEIEDE